MNTVYLHRDTAGEILYIGCTINLDRRTKEHRRYAEWRDQIAAVETDSVHAQLDAALAREQELIQHHQPAYNRAGNFSVHRPPRTDPHLAKPLNKDILAAVASLMNANYDRVLDGAS